MQTAEGIVGEFFALKESVEADILAMQCGDFYEFFGPDAELVERELDLNVSQKSSGGEKYPMAGVPLTELTPYLQALVDRGYRVAVADQYETEDGHAREITRVVTPGTLIDTPDASARYLMALASPAENVIGIAAAELSTGRFLIARTTGEKALERALSTCHRYDPVEILLGPTLREKDRLCRHVTEQIDARLTELDADAFAPGRAAHTVAEQFGRETIESLGLDEEPRAEVAAAGAVLTYARETGSGVLAAMARLTRIGDAEEVALDLTTQRNLELTVPMTEGGTALFDVIDRTVTTPGRRTLSEWLQRPRRDRELLVERRDGVEAFVAAPLAREGLRDELSDVGDLARLANRAVRGSADPRALRSIGETLYRLPAIEEVIANDPELADSPLGNVLDELDRDILVQVGETLDGAIREDPPRTIQEGDIFQRGYDPELDKLIDEHEAALEWIQRLAAREQERHGITHLQVDRNRTDGYYIQVGNSETDAVPQSYREIKSLKSSKRYTTDELEARERDILQLETARAEREHELFVNLRDRIGERAPTLQAAGRALGKLDTLAALATHAAAAGWSRPELAEPGAGIDIEDGRHPVVEATTEFVPNSVRLTPEEAFLLVTGPNMSGKSTYLRQTALITLLAHVGSFVPAASARIGLVDGIYTRVGALDELAHGRSTFMVEMQELSNILHSATDESLVILDEVGRGTATFDGMSIAWAATEYLHNGIGAYALFATHYHELTELADRLPRVRNVHVAVDEAGGDVTFLRRVKPGPANRSYGIHVARLAGVPEPVTDRADEVLAQLRADNPVEARGGDDTEPVQAVFDVAAGEFRPDATADGGEQQGVPPGTESVLAELRELEVEAERPIDLVARIAEWQDRLEE